MRKWRDVANLSSAVCAPTTDHTAIAAGEAPPPSASIAAKIQCLASSASVPGSFSPLDAAAVPLIWL
ncbi:hypothetical protein JJL56_32165 [Azospirillum sp. YIM DDC1]|uniref:Uncharacterized protein n=1 Tax=Azospirillum aestuarii TaxID=2802052 RepID=A0ABS1I8W7_9PROT|nr:hypothetical protein [Azospirillum aestuarii]MBK3778416.1 hypothetical protein [Azospirillum brasilense]MBK4723501.1 hypothetical protein [Azospirillum aestuarii]